MKTWLKGFFGEVPVGDVDALGFEAFFGGLLGGGGRDDHFVTGLPVGGAGDTVLVGGLESVDHADDLVEVTAKVQRIIDHRTDLELGVDEKDASNSGCVGRRLVDHVVESGDFLVEVGDDGELDLDTEVSLDITDPTDVRIDAVNGASDQLDVPGRKFIGASGKLDKLCGANRRKVRRMREQDHPATTSPFGKSDRAVGGDGLKVRG